MTWKKSNETLHNTIVKERLRHEAAPFSHFPQSYSFVVFIKSHPFSEYIMLRGNPLNALYDKAMKRLWSIMEGT